jgi:hypothetical protein
VGYVSSKVMDEATTRFYARQSEASKRKEEELAPGGSLLQLGKLVGRRPAATSLTTAPNASEWPSTERSG